VRCDFGFVLQVLEDFLDHHRILEARPALMSQTLHRQDRALLPDYLKQARLFTGI